jgi:acyl-CoA synthetase (NDP forming)
MVEFRRAACAYEAGAAAAGLGGHVVFKADVPGLLHKTAAGAVELDLHGAEEVRVAMDLLHARFAGRMSAMLVEPMITGGIETPVSVVQEPLFGPVVVFGLGGINTGVLVGHAARLAPLTGADAEDVICGIRAAPALQHAPGTGPLRDALLRVSRLARRPAPGRRA